MVTYFEQGKVNKTHMEQSSANTTPPACVSPKLKVLAQAKGVLSLKRALLA